MATVSVAVLLLWRIAQARAVRIGFYALFACAVTLSVQLVGVYLVFASLILPALATRRLAPRARVVAGLAMGAAAYVVGLIASAVIDLPSGPVVVLTMAALAGVTALVIERFAKAPVAPDQLSTVIGKLH